MLKQRVNVVPRDVCKHLQNLSGCHSNVPWATAKRIFDAKTAKIGPVDPEIICLLLKKKEITEGKIYCSVDKLAERAK